MPNHIMGNPPKKNANAMSKKRQSLSNAQILGKGGENETQGRHLSMRSKASSEFSGATSPTKVGTHPSRGKDGSERKVGLAPTMSRHGAKGGKV